MGETGCAVALPGDRLTAVDPFMSQLAARLAERLGTERALTIAGVAEEDKENGCELRSE